MNFKNSLKNSVMSVSQPRIKKNDVKVINGLAVTPTKMLEMSKHGIPITAQNEQNFYDGDTNPSWTINPEKMRNVDPADLWTMSMTARKKIRSAKRDTKN